MIYLFKHISLKLIIVWLFLMSYSYANNDSSFVNQQVVITLNDKPEKIDAILMHHWFKDHIYNAILITDPDELLRITSLFDKNERITQHFCGFDYVLRYRYNDISNFIILHNLKCDHYEREDDLIQSFFMQYAQRIENNPTHHIINISVPSSMDPFELVSIFKRDGKYIFFFDDPVERFPSIVLQASTSMYQKDYPVLWEDWNNVDSVIQKKTEQLLEKEIQSIAKKYEIVRALPPQNITSSISPESASMTLKDNLFFPFGTPVDSISTHTEGIAITSFKNPETYTAQLICEENISNKLKNKLHMYYPFINEIFK